MIREVIENELVFGERVSERDDRNIDENGVVYEEVRNGIMNNNVTFSDHHLKENYQVNQGDPVERNGDRMKEEMVQPVVSNMQNEVSLNHSRFNQGIDFSSTRDLNEIKEEGVDFNKYTNDFSPYTASTTEGFNVKGFNQDDLNETLLPDAELCRLLQAPLFNNSAINPTRRSPLSNSIDSIIVLSSINEVQDEKSNLSSINDLEINIHNLEDLGDKYQVLVPSQERGDEVLTYTTDFKHE